MESFKRLCEEACRGKGNICNRVEQWTEVDEQKDLRDKELQSEILKKRR